MTAISAPDLVLYRTTRHATQLVLDVYPPATIWSTLVNGAQTTGARSITVDAPTVVRTPGKHFQVLFGTAAGGHDLGEARFLTYAANVLTVSAHNAPLANDTFITVKEEIKPTAIHITMDDNDIPSEDGVESYGSSFNEQFIPLAVCKTHAKAYIDAVTGLATVRFWSDSQTFAGATLSSHLWVWRNGTVTVGSTVTAGTALVPNVVTWNAVGDYYCSYTVTDSNGKTHTRYFVVFIRLPGTSYTNLEVSGWSGNAESGVWQATLTLYGTATDATFPDHALCVLSAEDWYGATQVSIGGEAWRENIALVGYIRRGSTKYDWLKSTVEFQVESILGIAQNLWQLGGGIEYLASPTNWHQIKNLDYNLIVHHVLTRHSTLSQICDCHLDLPTFIHEYIDLTDTSVGEQLKQLSAVVRGRVGNSAQGSLYAEIYPQLQSLASRSVVYTIQTTNADIRGEVTIGEETQENQISQIDFSGEQWDGEPLFSLAPESPTATGRSEMLDGIRCDTQVQANEVAGLFFGHRNNQFGNVVIPWRGNYRAIDIFPANPIAVNITAASNNRGIVWATQRCWIKQHSYEYKAGILLASSVVEKDSYALPGISGEYPVIPVPWTPPTPPTPIPIDPTPLPPTLPPGGTNTWASKVYFMGDVKVYYSANFTGVGGAMPTWADVTPAGLGAGMEAMFMQPDPFDPLTTQYGLWRNGGSGDAELWKRTSGIWSLIATTASLKTVAGIGGATLYVAFRFQCDINAKGSIYVLARDATNSLVWLFKSANYGVSWSVVSSTLPHGFYSQFAIGYFKCNSPYAAGKVMYAVLSGDLYYVSTNGGLTWTLASTLVGQGGDNRGLWLDISQDIAYYWSSNGSGTNTAPGLYRSINRAATWTKIFDSLVQGYYLLGTNGGLGMHCYSTANFAYLSTNIPLGQAQTIRFMASSGADGSGTVRMYKSIDAGVTWTYTAIPATTTDGTGIAQLGIAAVSIVYSAGSKLYVCRASGSASPTAHAIYVSDDDCVTMQGKAGTDRTAGTVTGIPATEPCKFLLQVWTS